MSVTIYLFVSFVPDTGMCGYCWIIGISGYPSYPGSLGQLAILAIHPSYYVTFLRMAVLVRSTSIPRPRLYWSDPGEQDREPFND